MKHSSLIILTSILCAVLASCGEQTVQTPENTADAGQTAEVTEAAEENAVYPYAMDDLGGYEMRIANVDSYWGMFVDLDFQETTGEPLNDAVFERNRKVESELNCVIKEIKLDVNMDLNALNNKIRQSILAGEDTYDVTYYSVNNAVSMLTDGMMHDLSDFEELRLSEPWWDQYILEQVKFGDSVYFTSNASHLMMMDSAWALFMNEKLLGQYDMELPYQDVRAGTWTLDKLYSYQKAVTNLNGDDSFKWNADGNCIYGIALHPESPDRFIRGCDEYLVAKNALGEFAAATDSTRFQSMLDACAEVLDTTNGYSITASWDDMNRADGGYVYIFSVGRSLFLTAEIKTASMLRDMEDTFGVLPYPKLDETQENYNSSFCNVELFYSIPVTNQHLHETALISDVLAYESYQTVIPVYNFNRIEQKGLRNEESVEMLNIIRETMSVDMGVTMNWAGTLLSPIRTALMKGNSALSSTLEKNREKVNKTIAESIEAITALQAD